MKLNALSVSNLKESALYFDKILPFNIIPLVFEEEKIFKKITDNLFPEDYDKSNINKLYKKKKYLYNSSIILESHNNYKNQMGMKLNVSNTPEFPELNDIYINGWLKDTLRYVLIKNEEFDLIWDKFKPGYGNDLCFSIINLKIIDTTKISWEQILELRKDKELKKKLINFRLFFENEKKIQKWDMVEAKENILKMLYDYEDILKSYNINTVLGTINTVFSKDNLLKSLATGFISGSIFNDIKGTVIGASIPTVGISIETIKEAYNKKFEIEQKPVAFLYDAKKKLKIL